VGPFESADSLSQLTKRERFRIHAKMEMMFKNWPNHVWIAIGIAFLALISSGVGNYFQWKQLQAPAPLATSPVPASSTPSAHAEENASALPFMLTSGSSLLLFILLVLVARWHAKAVTVGIDHREAVRQITALSLGPRLKGIDMQFASLSSDSAEWKEAVRQRFAKIDDRADGVDHAANDHEERLRSLKMWVGVDTPHGGLWRDLVSVRSELHGNYTLMLLDLTQLMAEATGLAEGLLNIRKLSPSCGAARAPFSNDWSESIPSAIEAAWAASVNAHITHCKNFSNNYGLPEPTVIDAGFRAQLWSSQTDLGQSLSWIQVQFEKLLRFRRETVKENA
jgi:hypothetical protein